MNRRKYKPENKFFERIMEATQEDRTEFASDFKSTTERGMKMVMFVCFVCIVIILIYDLLYVG